MNFQRVILVFIAREQEKKELVLPLSGFIIGFSIIDESRLTVIQIREESLGTDPLKSYNTEFRFTD